MKVSLFSIFYYRKFRADRFQLV